MSQNTFNIYVMSYKRADRILSKNLFEYCTYVVREEEAEAYRAAGIEDMLVIPEEAEMRSFMSTLYWIIENVPEDVFFVADDDIEAFYYLLDYAYPIFKEGGPDKETITAEVERIAQLLVDLKLGLAFDQPTMAPYSYTQEFGFKGMPGHIRWINRTALKATYTRGDWAASDVDMMLQELMKNRIILQPKYLKCKAGDETNAGMARNRKAHYAFVEAMKNKWGRYYSYDAKKNIGHILVKR